MGIEHRLELGIGLDRRDARSLLQQRKRERANTRTHLEYALVTCKLGKLADTLNHMVVD